MIANRRISEGDEAAGAETVSDMALVFRR